MQISDKKGHSVLKKLSILLLAVVASVSANTNPVRHTKAKKAHKVKTEANGHEMNEIEHAEESEDTNNEIRHSWDKVNRTSVGGKEENMTLVQVIQFHGAV